MEKEERVEEELPPAEAGLCRPHFENVSGGQLGRIADSKQSFAGCVLKGNLGTSDHPEGAETWTSSFLPHTFIPKSDCGCRRLLIS